MARHRRPRARGKRPRFSEPIGLLDPEALVIHRDLEFLRSCGRREGAKRQHVRGGKWLAAQRMAEKGRRK